MNGPRGTLYHPDMGNNIESSVTFRRDGSAHQTVYDRDGGGRYSWDERADGTASDPHFTDQDGRNERDRHPFGR